jgi:hypothetical protein
MRAFFLFISSYALDPTKMKTEEEETPIEPIKIEPIPLAPSAAASASLSPEVILIEDDDEDTKQVTSSPLGVPS